MIENGYEKKETPFFSMDIQDSRYQIYFNSDKVEKYEPYGVISTILEDDKFLEEEISVEEWVIRLLRHFGSTEDIKQGDISYSVDEDKKLRFFGEFGTLTLDKDSNLLYESEST